MNYLYSMSVASGVGASTEISPHGTGTSTHTHTHTHTYSHTRNENVSDDEFLTEKFARDISQLAIAKLQSLGTGMSA